VAFATSGFVFEMMTEHSASECPMLGPLGMWVATNRTSIALEKVLRW
jgi:hypothetical protein